jgi:hypothetical protein
MTARRGRRPYAHRRVGDGARVWILPATCWSDWCFATRLWDAAPSWATFCADATVMAERRPTREPDVAVTEEILARLWAETVRQWGRGPLARMEEAS